jgi:hypothetical protein
VDEQNYEELPPDPAATIESLRSLGYTPESAIADLIDNSIAASATRVDVYLHWAAAESWCAIVDDGGGMTEGILREAMRIGSGDPLAERASRDLGRFGFGLKTASFSQCREMTVLTRTPRARAPHVRSWDLDHVRRVSRWELRRSAPQGAAEILKGLDPGSHGTVVLWRALDGLVDAETSMEDETAKRQFFDRIQAVDRHLGMTFGRFLDLGETVLEIAVNGHRVQPWDPFLEDEPATQRLAPEALTWRGHKVLVQPYVLPHRSKLSDQAWTASAGPLGWSNHQGFYVYRKDRLITAGDWLELGLPRDDSGNLARLSVDVPSELDRAWSLDIKKASVRPPPALREDRRRIARETLRRAKLVLRHRGVSVGGPKKTQVVPVWQQQRRHGEISFRLNLKHPLIADLLERAPNYRNDLRDLFAIIEGTIPVPLLPSKPAETSLAFSDRLSNEMVTLAEALYERCLGRGMSRTEAAKTIMNCEPFHAFPELADVLGGEHGQR